MNYVRIYFVGAIIAVIAFGCGPAKELPDQVPHTKEAAVGIAPDPYGKAPGESEPEAKAIAERAIKAITQNRIEVQAKARICRVTAKGKFRYPNTSMLSDAGRTIVSVWPDRVLTTYEFMEGAHPKLTIGLHTGIGWILEGKGPYQPNPNMTDHGHIINNDIMAQHWIPLTLGLTDYKAIFFAVQKNTPNAGMTSIKFGVKDMPSYPVYLISFDDRSGLPMSVDYHPIEYGQRVDKVVAFSNHKDAAGLMLPTSIQMTQNKLSTEQWVVDLWEFPDRFDDKSFDPPK